MMSTSSAHLIVRAATLRDDISLASFRHDGGFIEAADADLTDAQLRAAGRHRSARQLPNAHVSSSSLSPKSGVQSEQMQRVCHNERLTGCQKGKNTTG